MLEAVVNAFKIPDDISDDIASIFGVRDVIGPDTKLCADANGGLSAASARRLIQETEQAKLLYLEQPLPAESLAELAELNRLNIVAIGIDEGIQSRADIPQTNQARGHDCHSGMRWQGRGIGACHQCRGKGCGIKPCIRRGVSCRSRNQEL